MIKDVIAKIGQSRIRKCLASALHRLGVRLARECPLIAFLRGFGVDEVRDFPDARFSGLIQRTIDVPDIVHESGKVDFVDEPGSQ